MAGAWGHRPQGVALGWVNRGPIGAANAYSMSNATPATATSAPPAARKLTRS